MSVASRPSMAASADRSSSDQPARISVNRSLRCRRFSSNTRRPSAVAASSVARPSTGSAVRSTKPSFTRCPICLLIVDGSECTASASAPAAPGAVLHEVDEQEVGRALDRVGVLAWYCARLRSTSRTTRISAVLIASALASSSWSACGAQPTRSKTAARPWPPPMHIVSRP